jgi:hypothetical protein
MRRSMRAQRQRWVGAARLRKVTTSVRALPLLALAAAGCGFTRGAEDVKTMPAAAVKFAIAAPCSAAAAQGAVEAAAREMELDVEAASQGPGEPWVLRRGPRLNDGPLFYRVDVTGAANPQETSVIRVYSVPASTLITDTQETLAKPQVLAMRIVAACAAGGAR